MIASVPIDKTNVEVVDSEVAEGAEETGPAEVLEDLSETFVPEGADWRDAQYRGTDWDSLFFRKCISQFQPFILSSRDV